MKTTGKKRNNIINTVYKINYKTYKCMQHQFTAFKVYISDKSNSIIQYLLRINISTKCTYILLYNLNYNFFNIFRLILTPNLCFILLQFELITQKM